MLSEDFRVFARRRYFTVRNERFGTNCLCHLQGLELIQEMSGANQPKWLTVWPFLCVTALLVSSTDICVNCNRFEVSGAWEWGESVRKGTRDDGMCAVIASSSPPPLVLDYHKTLKMGQTSSPETFVSYYSKRRRKKTPKSH
jgi:hypothetical protein